MLSAGDEGSHVLETIWLGADRCTTWLGRLPLPPLPQLGGVCALARAPPAAAGLSCGVSAGKGAGSCIEAGGSAGAEVRPASTSCEHDLHTESVHEMISVSHFKSAQLSSTQLSSAQLRLKLRLRLRLRPGSSGMHRLKSSHACTRPALEAATGCEPGNTVDSGPADRARVRAHGFTCCRRRRWG